MNTKHICKVTVCVSGLLKTEWMISLTWTDCFRQRVAQVSYSRLRYFERRAPKPTKPVLRQFRKVRFTHWELSSRNPQCVSQRVCFISLSKLRFSSLLFLNDVDEACDTIRFTPRISASNNRPASQGIFSLRSPIVVSDSSPCLDSDKVLFVLMLTRIG